MMEGWREAARLDAFDARGFCEVAVGRELVLLIRRGEEVVAVQGLCPHAFARLSGGRVDDGGELHCPRHMARFRLTDGACVAGWVLPALRRYPVRVEDGRILLPEPLAPL